MMKLAEWEVTFPAVTPPATSKGCSLVGSVKFRLGYEAKTSQYVIERREFDRFSGDRWVDVHAWDQDKALQNGGSGALLVALVLQLTNELAQLKTAVPPTYESDPKSKNFGRKRPPYAPKPPEVPGPWAEAAPEGWPTPPTLIPLTAD